MEEPEILPDQLYNLGYGKASPKQDLLRNDCEESPIPEIDANQKEDWENQIINEEE